MNSNSTSRLSPSIPTPIEVEVRSFDYHQKGTLVGFADITLNRKLIIRGIAFFIPDKDKKAFIKWPSRSYTGPHGTEYEPLVQWVDIHMDFRLRGHIAKAVESYVLSLKSEGARKWDQAQPGPPPPRAAIPTELPEIPL